MADWADLHLEILVSILENVPLIEDFVAFGSVCKSWQEAFHNKLQYLRPQIPWLMLPDKDNHRQIHSIYRGDLLTRNLFVPEMSNRKCIGLNYGWVLTISPNGEMNLFHPFSRSQIQLPDQKTLYRYWKDNGWPSYIGTSLAALSANPLVSSSDFAVMIAHSGGMNLSYFGGMYLSYWRPGDPRWTRITNVDCFYRDLIHYQNRFYALDYNCRVWTCSASNLQDPSLMVDPRLSFFKGYIGGYIVESNGDLLAVLRNIVYTNCKIFNVCAGPQKLEEVERVYDWISKFEVYKLDLINGGYEPIKNLGDCAIFVGNNTSISLDSSKFPGLFKPNHIYFTSDYRLQSRRLGKDMGSYNLEDAQFTRFKVEESLSPYSPFWLIHSL